MGGCGWLRIPITLVICSPLVLLPVAVLRYVKVGFSPLVLPRSTTSSNYSVGIGGMYGLFRTRQCSYVS